MREVSARMSTVEIEIEVLCADTEIDGDHAELHDGVPIRTVRAWPRGRDYFLAPGIWSGIDAAAWDIVHVQSYHTLVATLAMGRALSSRIPYVVTFHGGGHSSPLRNRSRGVQTQLLGPLLRRAARLVAVARFEIEEYGSALRIPAERFALIPNGTELERADRSLLAAEPERTTLATIDVPSVTRVTIECSTPCRRCCATIPRRACWSSGRVPTKESCAGGRRGSESTRPLGSPASSRAIRAGWRSC